MFADDDGLAAFLDEVEKRCRTRSIEPWTELQRLGLVPAAGEVAVWTQMNEAAWFELLRGTARHDVGLAAALAGLRLATERRATVAFEGTEGATREIERAHTPLSMRLWRDRLALINGCLWKLWCVTVDHAESRPMFHRHLGDFPAVRFRLLWLLAQLLRADELAVRAAALAPTHSTEQHRWADLVGALRLSAQAVRIETQQICGGSGYMGESAYARALRGFDWSDALLRQAPMTDAGLDPALARDIDAAVARRLGLAQMSSVWRALLRPPSGMAQWRSSHAA